MTYLQLPTDVWLIIFDYATTNSTHEHIHRLARSICRRFRTHYSYIPRPPPYIAQPHNDRPLALSIDILEDTLTATWRKQLNYFPVCECCGERDEYTWPIEAWVGRYHFHALCCNCETQLRRVFRQYRSEVSSFKQLQMSKVVSEEWWRSIPRNARCSYCGNIDTSFTRSSERTRGTTRTC